MLSQERNFEESKVALGKLAITAQEKKIDNRDQERASGTEGKLWR